MAPHKFSLELDHILWIRTNLYAFFIFLAIFNHFLSAQNGFFLWRNYQIIVAKLDQINFIKLDQNWTYLMHNWQNGWVQKVFIHLSWKRQISTDSAGSGSNLNCSCLIVCYLFFPKIISSYISTYLIINTWFGGDTSWFGWWKRALTPERVNSHARRVVTAWLWCCHVF